MDQFKNETSKFPINSQNRRFFDKIFTNIGPNFASESIKNESIETDFKLKESMQRYFKINIIMNAVIEAMNHTALPKGESTNTSKSTGRELWPLYLNRIKKYVPPNESSCKYTALHQDLISKILEEKIPQTEKLEFTELVENNISEFCIKFTEYCGQYKFGENEWKRGFSETVKELSSTANAVQMQSVPSQTQIMLQEILHTYYEEMDKGICMLEKLLDLYKRKFELELDIAGSFALKALGIHLKLKLFELTVLRETYTEKTVPVLHVISNQLDCRRSGLLVNMEDRTFALQAYQFLGPEYDKLVEKYSKLCKEVKDRKWAIATYHQEHTKPEE